MEYLILNYNKQTTKFHKKFEFIINEYIYNEQFNKVQKICDMEIITRKYTDHFFYYFASDINKMIGKRRSNHHYIQLKDFAFLDCEAEFFKRFYGPDQVALRIQSLTQYFSREQQFPFYTPNLIITKQNKFMEKRKKRFKKLRAKLMELRSEEPINYDSTFLQSIKTQEIEQEQYQRQYGKSVSYESIPYNIYQNYNNDEENGGEDTVNSKHCKLPLIIDQQIEELQQGKQSQLNHLICDFNDVDVDRILKEYNNLQDNRKVDVKKISRKEISSLVAEHSFEKHFKEKLERNKINFYAQKEDIKNLNNVQGKVYFVKGIGKKNNEKNNENHDDYFPQGRSDRIKGKKIHLLGETINYDEKLKDLKKNYFKSPENKRLQDLQKERSATKIATSPQTSQRLGFKTEREKATPELLQKEGKYLRMLEKFKQKNQKEDTQRDNNMINNMNTLLDFKTSDKTSQKNKKLEKIKERAVQLINSKQHQQFPLNPKPLSLYKFSKGYQSTQIYNLPSPNMKY